MYTRRLSNDSRDKTSISVPSMQYLFAFHRQYLVEVHRISYIRVVFIGLVPCILTSRK